MRVHQSSKDHWAVAFALRGLAVALALFSFNVQAADQYINQNNPDPLEIHVDDNGRPSVWMEQNDAPRVRQYYDANDWGFYIWLNGADTSQRYSSGYREYSTDNPNVTPVSNASSGTGTAADPFVITTVVDLDTRARVTQTFSYVSGDRFFSKRWAIENRSGAEQTDVRFFYGGDTFYGGDDSARSWWYPERSMVYVNNATFSNTGYMGFYGTSLNPADRYYGGFYSSGVNAAFAGELSNTVDTSFVDAGYYLEWNRPTLAAGATWVVEGIELWSEPGEIGIIPPEPRRVQAGESLLLDYRIHNLSESSQSFSLDADSGTWTSAIQGGATMTLPALTFTNILIHVDVPQNAVVDDSVEVSLDAGPGSGAAFCRLLVFEPEYSISPSSVVFDSLSVGSTQDVVVTFSAEPGGVPFTLGTLNDLGVEAPFYIINDGLSDQIVPSGGSASVTVRHISDGTTPTNSLVLPVISPVVVANEILLMISPLPIAEIQLSGTNGVVLASGAPASEGAGTAFPLIASGTTLSETLSITNAGDIALEISGVSTDAPFSISDMPASILAGGVGTFTVDFSPVTAGDFSGSLIISNNSPVAEFELNFSGSAYALSATNGPAAGGNSITISAGTLGNGSDITSVLVDGVPAVILSQGPGFVEIEMPQHLEGAVNIVISSTSEGDTSLSNVYTFTKGDQSISFDNPGTQDATNAVALAGTATSGLDVDLVVASGPGVIDSGELTFSAAGSVSVVAAQPGNDYWNAAPNITNTFDVLPVDVTITLSQLNPEYDGTSKMPGVSTVPSGVTVELTYNNSPVAPTVPGTYTVIATIDDPLYQGAVTNTFIIAKANQTVSFSDPGQQTTTNSVDLSATASSGLDVTFSVVSGPASLSGNTLSFTGVGPVELQALQGGDSNWNPASSNLVVNVVKGTAGLDLTDLSQPYDGSPLQPTVSTAPEGLTVDLTFNNSPNVPTNAGTYTVIATIDDPNYQGSVTNTFIIEKAPAGITPGDLTQPHTGSPLTPTFMTTPEGLPVDLTFNNSPNVPTNAGTYTVIATIDDPNYQGSVTNTFTIAKGDQTIDFPNPGQQNVSDTVELSATASSGLGVTFSVISGPAVLVGTTLSFNDEGSVVIGAEQAGDSNWNSASTNVTFAVGPVTTAITLDDLNPEYDGSEKVPSLTTAPPGVMVALTFDGSPNAPTNVGTYTVIATVNQPGYEGAVTNTFTISKGTQTIAFPNLGTQTVTNTPTLAPSSNSGLPVGVALVSGPASLDGDTLSFSSPGEVVLVATQPGDSNWNASDALTNIFEVVGVITNVTPATGSIYGGDTILISGAWLGDGADITNVLLGTVEATIVSQGPDFVEVIAGPSAVATNVDVTVVSAGFGPVVLGEGFEYVATPPAVIARHAVNVTNTAFTARWYPAEGATGYAIDVSESPDFSSYFGAYSNWVVGDVSSALISGLVDGSIYYYRVRGENGFGSGLDSNVIETPTGSNTPYEMLEYTNGVVSAGSSDRIDLSTVFHGTGLTYSIVGNNNPNLVNTGISGNELFLGYTGGAAGTIQITVRATGPDGFYVDTVITIEVVPAPLLIAGPMVLNPQNGLFEQLVQVVNQSARAATSITLTAANLTASASLHNATGMDENGHAEIHWVGTLAGSATREFILQYYTPLRGVVPAADLSASLSLEAPEEARNGVEIEWAGQAIDQEGRMLFMIEFAAVPGQRYYIQYTPALDVEWRTVQPVLTAPVNRVQWIDSGPPLTDSLPADAPSRFYRVIEAND